VQAERREEPSSLDTGNVSSITGQSVDDSSNSLDDVRRSLHSTSPSNATTATGSTEKKSRRSSKAKQKDDAVICKKRKAKARGMKAATTRIHQNMQLSPSNPEKKNQADIVREVNTAFGSNVNAKTAARMVRKGRIRVSPLKRGPVGNFPKHIWVALKTTFVSYVKLELANSKIQSTMKDHSKRVNAIVNKGGYNKTRYDLVRKLKHDTANELEVGKKNAVEQRRVAWTSYNNLRTFYEMWEQTVISLGFGRKKVATDSDAIVQ
jgi:hypothetical protein